MKVMVIGGGGREHAIVKKLKQSRRITSIVVAPGNGGIARDAECVDIDAEDLPTLANYASDHGVDYVVVAPDGPLVAGLVDELQARGIEAFGPNRDAAHIEGSKAFAKDFMRRHQIPTANYEVFDDEDAALAHIANCPLPVVIKADGLALGKGVTVAETRDQAVEAVRGAMSGGRFGSSGARLVIEDYLTGPEVSVLAFTDGTTVTPMVSAMDHKRIGEGDLGPNTGGMGTIAPSPVYTPEIAERCRREIFEPTVAGLAAEGRPFTGCLYFGLMLTPTGPKVIEYNCRFGDPETQVVLPLLRSDLLEIMLATTHGTLAEVDVTFADEAAACIVVASAGYPGKAITGIPISISDEVFDDVVVAGARKVEGQLVTSGGRVLGVVATSTDVPGALAEAYRRVGLVSFEGAYYRKDIGTRVLGERL